MKALIVTKSILVISSRDDNMIMNHVLDALAHISGSLKIWQAKASSIEVTMISQHVIFFYVITISTFDRINIKTKSTIFN